jgi:ankyrin repeat protein
MINKFNNKTVVELYLVDDECYSDEHPEKFWIHIAYWCSFFGIQSALELFVEKLGFSPFLRAYKMQSILVGAIRGNQQFAVKYLLNFSYLIKDQDDYEKFIEILLHRDERGNTALHYAYDLDQPEVRSLLKQNGLFF